jgi:hypothetical protein
MPTLRNLSSQSIGDLRRNGEREFTEEEMKAPNLQRALRTGRVIEVESAGDPKDSRAQQQPQRRR